MGYYDKGHEANYTNFLMKQQLKTERKFTEGEQLNFNVHGFLQCGTFIREYSKDSLIIKVIDDSYNPKMKGKETLILKAFLI